MCPSLTLRSDCLNRITRTVGYHFRAACVVGLSSQMLGSATMVEQGKRTLLGTPSLDESGNQSTELAANALRPSWEGNAEGPANASTSTPPSSKAPAVIVASPVIGVGSSPRVDANIEGASSATPGRETVRLSHAPSGSGPASRPPASAHPPLTSSAPTRLGGLSAEVAAVVAAANAAKAASKSTPPPPVALVAPPPTAEKQETSEPTAPLPLPLPTPTARPSRPEFEEPRGRQLASAEPVRSPIRSTTEYEEELIAKKPSRAILYGGITAAILVAGILAVPMLGGGFSRVAPAPDPPVTSGVTTKLASTGEAAASPSERPAAPIGEPRTEASATSPVSEATAPSADSKPGVESKPSAPTKVADPATRGANPTPVAIKPSPAPKAAPKPASGGIVRETPF